MLKKIFAFQASMKLQNKQEIALFKGEGERDNTELDSSSSLRVDQSQTFSFEPHDFWPAETLEQPTQLKLDFDLFSENEKTLRTIQGNGDQVKCNPVRRGAPFEVRACGILWRGSVLFNFDKFVFFLPLNIVQGTTDPT